MKTSTSILATFDAQRDSLAEHLVAICKDRTVDSAIAQPVIDAVDMLDPQSFDKIQRATLMRLPEAGRNNSYLDFCKYIAKAMSLYIIFVEKHRELAETPIGNRKILDVGSGSGAFSFVCNALGHHSVGLDKPQRDEKDQSIPLNYLLTQWYNVDVIEHDIKPMVSFPIEDRCFDDFALFHPNFHRRWNEQHWDFLFSDLARCATINDSKIHVLINKPKISAQGDVYFSVEELSRSIAKYDYTIVQDRCYIIHLT